LFMQKKSKLRGLDLNQRLFGREQGVVLTKRGTDWSAFAVGSLWGKFRGLHTCGDTFRHTVPLPNSFLTRFFSEVRLKRKDFPEVAPVSWAQEASGSNPDAPTKTSRVFSLAYQKVSSPKTSLWNSPRQEVRIRKSFDFRDLAAGRVCKNMGRHECNSESIERNQVKRAPLGQYGGNHGDPVHFSSHRSSEIQISDHALGSARAPPCLSIAFTIARSRSTAEKLISSELAGTVLESDFQVPFLSRLIRSTAFPTTKLEVYSIPFSVLAIRTSSAPPFPFTLQVLNAQGLSAGAH
jgi:hypothetical protein